MIFEMCLISIFRATKPPLPCLSLEFKSSRGKTLRQHDGEEKMCASFFGEPGDFLMVFPRENAIKMPS